MAEIVTLTLSTETAERLHEAASRAGKPIEAVLTEWIEEASIRDRAFTLQPDTQYAVWSPLNSGETAIALQKFIDEQRQKQDSEDRAR